MTTRIRAAQVNSGTATVGQVIAADGSGNSVWETVDHNATDNLQGGATGERYHLTAAEHAALGGGEGALYRQFVYSVSGGTMEFVVDELGYPVMSLEALE
jgi:hypothetical protein